MLTYTENRTAPDRQPLLISKKEAAHLLGVCLRTVDYLVAAKELSAIRVGKRVLVKYASLVAFTRRDHVTPAPGEAHPSAKELAQ